MKFILQESTKFILEERFILQEETLTEAQATAKQLVIDLNKLDTLFPELVKHLTNCSELSIDEEIKTSCVDILKLITETKDFKELMNIIRKKASATEPEEAYSEDMIKILQPLCYNIAAGGNSIKDRLKDIRSHKGEISEQSAALQERIPSFKKNIEDLYKLFEDKLEKPTEYKYTLNDSEIELKKGNKYILKVNVEPEKELEVVFKSADEDIATVEANGTITAVAVGEVNITAEVDKTVLTCKVKVTDSDTNDDSEDLEDTDTSIEYSDNGIDWEAEYNAAVNKDAVWEEYLNTVWEDDFDKINLIKEAFRQECISYGFDKTNPFITFIKKTYLKSNMPKHCYNAIHNAVVDKHLSTEDLIGNGEIGKHNIIFCTDLYTKNEANIAVYLKRQHDMINKGKPEKFDSLTEFVVNVMYTTIKQSDTESKGVADLKLNTLARINELELTFTGSVTKDDKSKKDKTKIDDSTIQKIKNTEEAVQILTILALRFAASNEIIKSVTQYDEVTKLLASSNTIATLQKLVKHIDTKFNLMHISETQATILIKKIIESDKFELTKK